MNEILEPSIDGNASPPTQPDGLGRRHLGWLAALVVAVLLVAMIDGPAGRALERWGWLDRDERFTELSFPDHLALPERLAAGDALSFDFSVRNREGRTAAYRWVVLVGASVAVDPARAVASGDLRLDDDEVRVVHVELDDVLHKEAVVSRYVTVALDGRDERIHFRVEVEPGTS